VQLGILKINVHISNIRKLEDSNTTSNTRIASRKQFTIQNRNVGLELDIRGQVLDEAIMNLDKYLDDAFLAGLTEVNIIHGKGTGTLRGGIHQHLKYHPHVKSFRLGRFGEGESGVTVVELK